MVSITEVPMELRSWVGAAAPGKTQARETLNKTITDRRSRPVDKRIGCNFRIEGLLLVINGDHKPKNAESSAI